MLRIHFLAASAVSLFGLTGTASAADITRIPAPPPAPAIPVVQVPAGWSGPYVGLEGGYGWGTGTVDNNGWDGGAYAGYNAQVHSNLVVGVEGDFMATSKRGSSGGTTVTNPWDGTVRGRVGLANSQWLLYGTGGVAFGQVKANTGGTIESADRTGWTAGAGIEAKVTDKVTARAEYRYTDLGTSHFTTAGPTTYQSNEALVGVGVQF